jgi:selenocysteine-specific elongation factor
MTIVRGVVAMAGHVDHGKTSLVRALTGTSGDRRPEEKARGITIDLGYARWETGAMRASIVDVPGHERFVGTMVAGVAGIDGVLLVVAADDGVMPQTREHVAICAHLGVTRGVIAITKADAVEPEMLALARDDVRTAMSNTFLRDAPIVATSVTSGVGLDALAHVVSEMLTHERRVVAPKPAWLSIDRVFARHGHGTIVTGTLARGTIAVDDALDLLTRDGRVRVIVRGLEQHGEAIATARAGTRVAVNLRGVERDAIARGDVLATDGWQTPTASIDVALTLDDPPARDVSLHIGTAQRIAKLTLLSDADGTKTHLARLRLDAPLATFSGDRFVLRRASSRGACTIGGGEVIDPHPALARPRRTAAPFARAIHLDPRERVRTMATERAVGVSRASLSARLPSDANVGHVLSQLVRDGELVEVRGETTSWVAAAQLDRAKSAVRAALVVHHREQPAAGGATIHELAGRVPSAWRALVPIATAALVREGAIAGGDRVAAIGHDASALADAVRAIYVGAGMSILDEATARERSALPERTFRDVVGELVRVGHLERIANGVHVDRGALDQLVLAVRTWLASHEELSPGDFKSLSGLTRKHAIPMLEWLDRHGVTRRTGDRRVRA